MIRPLLLSIALVALSVCAFGQYNPNQVRKVNSLPATCTAGTTTPVVYGAVVYTCTATNTWTANQTPGQLPTSTYAGLPTCAAGNDGQMYRVTDVNRDIYSCYGTSGKWASRNGGVYNVKDFGAVGDGTTDDTTAINAAITAAPTGARVSVSNGTFKITSPFLVSGKTSLVVQADRAIITPTKNTRWVTITGSADITVAGFSVIGTIDTDAFTDNEEQGRIVPDTSTGVYIFNNRWYKTAAAVFVQVGCTNVDIHHNQVLLTHAGIQSSSAVYSSLSITDNYFLGHVFNIADKGSDDQIAIFGSGSSDTLIARNIIDKQGPTAYNQAHGILIAVGDGNNARVIVSDNVVKNVITTNGAYGRAAIEIAGIDGTHILKRAMISGNQIENCNAGIFLDSYTDYPTITRNIINAITSVSSYPSSNSGIGINVVAGSRSIYATISGNTVTAADVHGINITNANDVSVVGNTVSGSGNRGLSLDTVVGAVVTGNTLLSNQDGLFVNAATLAIFEANNIRSNSRYGVRLQATNNGVFASNLISSSGTSNYSDAGTTTFQSLLLSNVSVVATSGGTTTLDLYAGSVRTVTMPAGDTTITATNIPIGPVWISITEDSIGSRAITWNSLFLFAGGTKPTLTTTANATDLFQFLCNGTSCTLVSAIYDVK